MGSIGDGIVGLFYIMAGLCVVFVPLGAWKLIEIVLWFWSNIHWGVK